MVNCGKVRDLSSSYILQELPKDKWFCCDDCDKIHIALQKSVSAGFQTILASSLSTINRKHIEKGLIDGFTDDVQWRILSGKSRFPEDLPLLSRATAIFRVSHDGNICSHSFFSILLASYCLTSVPFLFVLCC